ncbi:MAG: aminotransferase, partial [Deltaproteobacteria bacterium]|nr:aminotransferase [Deltaproteobacteria bacterium]
TGGSNIQPDKRFVYYLLAATGICVVPLTSFNTSMQGFRLTLLETDENMFCTMLDGLRQGIEQYIKR